jgi:predicted nucleotidyltransferase
VAAGNLGRPGVLPEDKLAEFVSRLRTAAGSNLRNVILYGSAVSGGFDPDFSDINLLCILHDTSLPSLEAVAKVARWWVKTARALPFFITLEEFTGSADVFVIEMLDLKSKHRVIYGEDDPVASLDVPMKLHRVQIEYEFREKLILLRQQLLLASGDRRRTWAVLQRSLPAFATLFRHVLIARGEQARDSTRETMQAMAEYVGCNPSPFYAVIEARKQKSKAGTGEVRKIATEYVAAVEQAVRMVDKMLESQS